MAKVKFRANGKIYWLTADVSVDDGETPAVDVLKQGTTKPIARVPVETLDNFENSADRIAPDDAVLDLTSHQSADAEVFGDDYVPSKRWRELDEMAEFLGVTTATVKRRESRGELVSKETENGTVYAFSGEASSDAN